jgi:ketosteroid isomerase-like protein
MTWRQNIDVARRLLAAIGEGADQQEVAALFSHDVRFEIAGEVGALPWIGQRSGRRAVRDFIGDTRRLLERVRFDVDDILASDNRVAVVGELVTRIVATGKTIESAFAIVLTISDNGEIARFQMLEDSFAVSRAARP